MGENDYAIKSGSGLDLIIKERERQISDEGWTPEHDAKHTRGDLAIAAACYAVEGTKADVVSIMHDKSMGEKFRLSDAWPWDMHWDKRGDHEHERRLVIAGALIAAEIDRLKNKI